MKDSQIILIAVPIFIILLLVIFRTIKDSLKFDTIGSLILSVCVSVLATLSLNSTIGKHDKCSKQILLDRIGRHIAGLFNRENLISHK